MSNANIALVRRFYEAFPRGDVDTIVGACAPEVIWRVVGSRGNYPVSGDWIGPEGVADFFRSVAELQAFQEFSAHEFHACDDKVFVLGFYAFTVKTTGCALASEWCHVITIRDGQIVAYREFTDTAQLAAAYRASEQAHS